MSNKLAPMQPDQMGLMSQMLDPVHRENNPFEYEFSQQIWQDKYSNNGKDTDVSVTFLRVAKAIASCEKNPDTRMLWEEVFYHAMTSGCFIPAGRILAGAGTANRVTLVNCFVNRTVPDSMEGI